MRTSTVTKLSLADFARVMGISPIHIAQVTFVPAGRTPKLCDQAYMQYDWQDADRISRESIASAISEAEELIERALGYRLLPSWEVDEWQPTERHFKPERERVSSFVQAKWGHFISGGIRSKELIDDAVAITYSDADSDTYKETATISVTVDADLSSCEVHLYYPGKAGNPAYEIRPINVSISNVTATITFRRELAVLEALQEAVFPEPVNGVDDAAFLTTVDVYRVYNDPQTQASFLWEPRGGCGCSSDGGCANCSYTTQTGCIYLREDPRLSLLIPQPADWSSEDLSFTTAPWAVSRGPDMVRLFYYSGYRDKRLDCVQDMDQQWKRTVAHFAAALLDRPPCDCVLSEWDYWRQDVALQAGGDSSNQQVGRWSASQRDLDCPFGTRRGAIDAWRRCLDQGLARVAVAT